VPETPDHEPVPATARAAGGLVAMEGAAGVIVAVVYVVREVFGHRDRAASGYGTAGWFVLLGGAILAAGIALLTGRRWGRAIGVLAQLLLLPFVWSLLTGSHQPVLGAVVGLFDLATLAMLFAPTTTHWIAAGYRTSGR
jgi:hypothetical protein